MYSTSRLPYHLRVKGAIGTLVLVQKLEAPPWTNVPLHHPLVPLGSLERVKDKQQICVAAQIAENPGSMERDTVNGRMLVCNAIIQQGGTKVRCAFWRDHAEKLASFQTGACVLLYQVLAEKKKEGSWEVGSWRGTQILECPEDLAKSIQADLMQPSDCRTLTLVPTRNWKECEAVPTPRRRVSAAGPQEYLSHASEALGGLLLVGVKRRPLSEQDQSSWPGVCRELDSSTATWRSSAGCDHADGHGERVVGFVARRNLPRRFAGSQGVLHFFKPSAAGKRCSQI